MTIHGRITLRRRRGSGPGLGSVTPVDALLDAAEATLTVGVRELACRLNQASHNFDKAAENLARAAQVVLSGEWLRQVPNPRAEGRAVLQTQQSGALVLGWTAADCHVPPPAAAGPAPAAPPPTRGTPATAATRIYLGSDGVKVPLVTDAEKQARRTKIKQQRRRRGRKCRPLPKAKLGADQRYQEFKIVTFYDEQQTHRQVSVTQGDHQAAGALMRHDACRLRLDQADDKVAVIDGAPWIRNQIKGQSLPLDVIELDFYHLADKVHKARRVVYGEEAPDGQAWAAAVLPTAKHAGYVALRDQLVAWKATVRGTKKRKAAELLLDYVTDRRDMVEYPAYLAAGRQIGSGPTESMCKTTTARLKGVGMRWDAVLDALEQSGEWKRYWELCLQLAV